MRKGWTDIMKLDDNRWSTDVFKFMEEAYVITGGCPAV